MIGRALVTGASRGIGAAIARSLSQAGWSVVVNYRESESLAQDLAREISGIAVCADVSDEHAVREMFDKEGPFDLLVNNAGISYFGLLSDTGADTWRRLFAVNVEGMYNCARCAQRHMIKNQKGIIINISSIWGIVGASCETAYASSKSAVVGLTLSLAKELGPSGIRVNCIAPGAIESDMLISLSELEKADIARSTALGRLGIPEDVAGLAVFLASERADFITGQVIGVDGGFGR